MFDADDKVEVQEVLLTNVVRKELGDLAEFMFLLQQPEAYTKWKTKEAEEAEEEAEAEAGDYEYVELDDMSPEAFGEMVDRLNQLPLEGSGEGSGVAPDLLPMDEEEDDDDDDYYLG